MFVHEDLQKIRRIAPWLVHQNLSRYQWAAGFVAGLPVAEVGCGGGHGSALLAEAGAARVDGFDIEPASIERANREFGRQGLSFQVADAGRLPAADATYEVVVSLETLEHVPRADDFLHEIRRVLAPGGLLLCSTPNRRVSNPGISLDDAPFNPYHRKEYTAEELQDLLEGHFSRVELLGQSPYGGAYVGTLNGIGRLAPRLAVRLHQLRKIFGIPFEKIDKHRPQPLKPRRHPEVLVCRCQ